ncbi:MAG: hypothetical protein Q8P41_31750 [Pseudomonadota bacterium]|nr:hypothetical protein [Pseudomonadota bacterium]
MKIPRGFFPSKATAKGKDAPSNLADCNLVVRDGSAYLCATDGHIAVVVLAEEYDPVADLPGHIPVEAVEGAETNRTDEWNPRITAGPGAVIVDLSERPQQILSASRSEGALYPDLLTVAQRAWATPPRAIARLNVKLLSRLARAIGTEAIELGIHGEGGRSFITVRRAYEDDRFMALLAPMAPADAPAPAHRKAADDEERDDQTKSLLDEILESFGKEREEDEPEPDADRQADAPASVSAGADDEEDDDV